MTIKIKDIFYILYDEKIIIIVVFWWIRFGIRFSPDLVQGDLKRPEPIGSGFATLGSMQGLTHTHANLINH